MEDLRYKNTLFFYRVKFKSKLAKFNHPSELPDYFGPMIGDKKKVVIAEIGAGPICTIGNSWKDVDVKIYASDILQPQYAPLWTKYKATPVVPVEYQNMEHLTYPDEFFDIVHCVNALDHTIDAKRAIKEMIRVCKKGGYIYLRHAPDQREEYGGMHEWNINEKNGECVLSNPEETFKLDGFKTTVEDKLIVAICQKI